MLTRSLVVLSLSAALLTGCGDDEPKANAPAPVATTPASPATTPGAEAGPGEQPPKRASKADPKKAKAAWVATVNKRCKQYAGDTTKVLRDFSASGNTSPAAATDAMQSVIPLGQEMIEDLRKVDAEDAQQEFTEFLDTLDGAFELMPEITKSLAAGKQNPELMTKLGEIEKKTRPFADEYGLTECLGAGG